MNNQQDQVPWTLTFSQIQHQIQQFGFAAVMMHPQEFSMLDANKNPTEVVNTTHINQLVQLINAVKSAG